jgi:hypothetical protein
MNDQSTDAGASKPSGKKLPAGEKIESEKENTTCGQNKREIVTIFIFSSGLPRRM